MIKDADGKIVIAEISSVLDNEYTSNGWVLPVNKWCFWESYKKMGFYEPANDRPILLSVY